jgi:hypothetical protein
MSEPVERPVAANSPFIIPGRWYREHPFELLEAELQRRGMFIPPDRDTGTMADMLAADDDWATGGAWG